jgi:TolB protein
VAYKKQVVPKYSDFKIMYKIVFSVILIASATIILAKTSHAQSDTTIVVSDPQRQVAIALPILCVAGGSSTAEVKIPKVIARDLELSGYFKVIDPRSYLEPAGTCTPPESQKYEDWRVLRSEWLVKGRVVGSGSSVKLQLYLHDVPGERIAFGKEYQGSVGDIPQIAHRFANEIMRIVTGEYGPFGSEIVFSGRVGRFKDLFIMDMDGNNTRQLTNERGLALSPRWDKNGRRLLYTSYRRRIPDLFLLDVANRGTSPLTSGPALEVGGVFLPNGNVVTSVTEQSDSSLVELTPSGQIVRTLTPRNRAIDVSPTLSPDGSRIAFCSDRAGGPQIYVMPVSGGESRRISFVTSRYCTSPSWSPKGDRIAFVCRADGGFQMFVSGADGQNPIQLTSGGDNEDPSWSPDGRYLAYATTMGGGGVRGGFSIAMMRVVRGMEGSAISTISTHRGDATQPSWGPLPGQ